MGATIIGLQGDLGSGKTHFVQKFGQVLGIEEHIVSPTFVIMKYYDVAWSGFKKLIHIDAYRLESSKELLDLGWEDLISNPENLIFIEWPEKVEDIIPPSAKRILFKHDQ